eukprot:191035-Lingulodinium_polyedra.AAC.1
MPARTRGRGRIPRPSGSPWGGRRRRGRRSSDFLPPRRARFARARAWEARSGAVVFGSAPPGSVPTGAAAQ